MRLVPDCFFPPPVGYWSTPATTGRTPPSSAGMTLTRVDRRRVVWFGGWDGQRRRKTNALFILDIEAWVSGWTTAHDKLHTCTNTYMYAHTDIHTHTHTHTRTHTHTLSLSPTNTHSQTHSHTHTFTHTCICTCTIACM